MINPLKPPRTDESKDDLAPATTCFLATREEVHISILTLTHEIDPLDLLAQVLGEAVLTVEIHPQRFSLRGRGRLGQGDDGDEERKEGGDEQPQHSIHLVSERG